MQITLFSLFMSVVWSSVLAAFNYFCRKKHFFIRQLGITNIMFLYLFSIIRMLVPYKFSFTRVIPSKGAFSDLCRDTFIYKTGTAQISLFSVFVLIWAVVSAILLIRFFIQYLRAMQEFSAYRIREDEQCQRVFQRVLNHSSKQLKVQIRSSDGINIPMGAGVLRKSIILPEEEYTDSELFYILRHEYTHFLNRDLVLKTLIHIYWCLFWWNPAIYLLKRDFAQILEIKCDLDVTDKMEKRDKVGYLTTIVTLLKNAEVKREQKSFYGTIALAANSYESEIVERFKIVSASYSPQRRNLIFTGIWFLAFGMLIILSYSFVIQPDFGMPENGSAAGVQTRDSSYYIECIDDTYYVHFGER